MSEEQDWSLAGKTVLITGGNVGIGRGTAIELGKFNPRRIIIACRNVEVGEETAKQIYKENEHLPPDTVVVHKLDLTSPNSVKDFAKFVNENEHELHVLINNAGIVGPPERQVTEEGYELTFATNHLGPFLLTNLLLPLIKKSAPSRIVMVSGDAYKACWRTGFRIDDPHAEKPGDYWRVTQYCQTKLANILFTVKLHQILGSSGVSVFALHPGVVNTQIGRQPNQSIFMTLLRKITCRFMLDEKGGAVTSVYCATQPGLEKHSGGYFSNKTLRSPWQIANDQTMADRLWDLSETLTGVKY